MARPPAATAPFSSAAPPSSPSRLLWIDHLRAVLTVFVVAHHAAQAYGPTGGAWPVSNPERSPVLGVFIAVNAMYFMSLFFFVSGVFTPGTLARKGPRAFVTDRLWRLGVPSVVVFALTAVFMDRPQFLHLWFVVDLLVLNLAFVVVQAVRGSRAVSRIDPLRPTATAPIGTWQGLGAALVAVALLSVGTALVRVRWGVDDWVALLGILPLEPAHWVHYLGAFTAGIVGARARWLERVSDGTGRSLFMIALLVVTAYAAYRLWPTRAVSWFDGGGATAGMVRLAVLESLVCVTLSGGLLWAFRRFGAKPSPLLGALAADAYGIYCVHLPLVIVVQLAIADLPAGPLVKFALATTGGLLLSWLLTRFVLRRSAWGRRIF